MAWTGLALTVDGQDTLNKAQLSGKMNIKSIVVGDGDAPANFRTLKTLVHQLYEITDIHADVDDGKCTLTVDIPQMEYDYYFREIGVIVVTDEGEKLYVYDNCSDSAQYIVSTTGVETARKRIRLVLNISDVAEITVVDPGILYVDYEVYEKAVDQLDTNIQGNKKKIDEHIADKENPHHVTAKQLHLENVDNTHDVEKPVSTAQQAAINAAKKQVSDALASHTGNTNNPHKVTKGQVGLGNADNTSDVDKPVSTAQQAALDELYQQMTAYTQAKIADLINGAPTSMDTLKEVSDAIAAHKSVMDALDAAIGKKANAAEFDSHVKDTMKHITVAERAKWDDANSKKHTHDNKSVLDGITSILVNNWNNAVTHISDAVKHITAAERDKWNNHSHTYASCTTAAGTAAKTVACTGYKLATGAEITVKFSVTNTAANPTLNVNSTGAKPIYYRGAAISAGYLAANRTYTFRYNGTQYELVGDINTDTNTTYGNMKGATATAAGTAGLAPMPNAGSQDNYLKGSGGWENVDNHIATFSSVDVDDGGASTWTVMPKLGSKEDHKTIFNKLSIMLRNVRYLYKMLGTTDISQIGGGTVTGAIASLNTGIDNLYRHSDVIYDGSGTQIFPATDYIQLTNKKNLAQYAFLLFDVRTASSVGDWNAQLMPIISIMQGVLPMVYSAPTANYHFKTSFMISGNFDDNTVISVFVQDNPVTVRIFGIY